MLGITPDMSQLMESMAGEEQKIRRKGSAHLYRECEDCKAQAIIIENKKYYCANVRLKAGIRPLTKLMISEIN